MLTICEMLIVHYSREHSNLESTSKFKLKTLVLIKILSLERLSNTKCQWAKTTQPAHTQTKRVTQIILIETKTFTARAIHHIGIKTWTIRIKYVSSIKEECRSKLPVILYKWQWENQLG